MDLKEIEALKVTVEKCSTPGIELQQTLERLKEARAKYAVRNQIWEEMLLISKQELSQTPTSTCSVSAAELVQVINNLDHLRLPNISNSYGCHTSDEDPCSTSHHFLGVSRDYALGLWELPNKDEAAEFWVKSIEAALYRRTAQLTKMICRNGKPNHRDGLPGMVRDKLERTAELRRTTAWQRAALVSILIPRLMSQLKQLHITLSTFIMEQKLRLQRQICEVNVQFLEQVQEATARRALNQKLMILEETYYTSETVSALDCLHKELTQALTETRASVDQSNRRLAEYTSLGEEFKQVAADYGRILHRLQESEKFLNEYKTIEQETVQFGG